MIILTLSSRQFNKVKNYKQVKEGWKKRRMRKGGRRFSRVQTPTLLHLDNKPKYVIRNYNKYHKLLVK